jgi:plastocyanin domain-containing protein
MKFRLGVALALIAGLAAMGCGGAQSGSTARYNIKVSEAGYEPAHVKAHAGQNVVLVFTRTTDATCGTEVIVPSENDTVPLPLNQPVEVHLVAKEKGDITFHCGMKMLEGSVQVD